MPDSEELESLLGGLRKDLRDSGLPDEQVRKILQKSALLEVASRLQSVPGFYQRLLACLLVKSQLEKLSTEELTRRRGVQKSSHNAAPVQDEIFDDLCVDRPSSDSVESIILGILAERTSQQASA